MSRNQIPTKDRDDLEAELFQQIGQLKVELEWLKKNLRRSCREEATGDRADESDDSDLPALRAFGLVPVVLLLQA